MLTTGVSVAFQAGRGFHAMPFLAKGDVEQSRKGIFRRRLREWWPCLRLDWFAEH